MLSHFLWSPASALCCESSQLAERVAELSGAQLAGLRALPSVRAHPEQLGQEEGLHLQRDDEAFKVSAAEERGGRDG